jgi:hypothetical protein
MRLGSWKPLHALALLALVGVVVVALVVAVVDAGAARTSARAASPPTIACGEAIGQVKSGRQAGYRVVLGVVSAPPAYLKQIVATRSEPWRYWRKAGLLIRAGSPAVFVSVPTAWQERAAITWGDSGTVSALRVGSCPPPATVWNAYAGGFYLRTPSACVPLVFRVGKRSATVWFGLGRACAH